LTNSTASEKYYVYTPDSMPVRYHYSANKRIGDIVLEAKKGGKIFRYVL
jgi:hypothetical protein